MERTPKLQRKISLSLGNRLNNRRHSVTRRTGLRSTVATNTLSTAITCDASGSSPTVCIPSDVESTPPHKKFNLDDSVDFSPKSFDSSFSPSDLLSQTVMTDSPEVGWRWGRRCSGTPDTIDCGSISAGSSNTETPQAVRRSETQRQRLLFDVRRLEQRKVKDMEILRAEKIRADEKLKMRCAKLKEQLEGTELKEFKKTGTTSNVNANIEAVAINAIASSSSDNMFKMKTRSSIVTPSLWDNDTTEVDTGKKDLKTNNDTLSDFLNDSDSDCLLMEVTQQIESKMTALSQTESPVLPFPNIKSNSTPGATTRTPNSSCTEKRSSFYMQFLEDDFSDDWFVTLDEVEQNATKAKNLFQRYNSMPTETGTKTASSAGNMPTNSKQGSSLSDRAAINAADRSKMKRHASSHSLSPSNANYRGRQLHLRK